MREVIGDIFKYSADCICITTNGTVKSCGRNIMGIGVALTAKLTWPGIDRYLGQQISSTGIHVTLLKLAKEYALVAFPVKYDVYDVASLGLIEKSCRELVDMTNKAGWKTVALVKPGCGVGGLFWTEVKPVCAKHFDDRFVIVDKQ